VIAAAVCAGLCLVAGLLAFANPTSRSVSRPISYIQSERFGYAAPVTPGPVYPDGTVRTGQPIFLHLARTVRVWGEYRFTTRSVRQVGGAGSMSLVLTGPTGWRRTLPIAGTMRFEGPRGVLQATLDLTALEGLLAQIQRLTGISAQSGYTIAVVARTRLAGVVAGRPLRLTFAPALTFQLQSLQLQVSAASGSGGTLYQVKKGSIPSSATVANHLEVLGRAVAVGPLRWLALIGFWIAASAVAGLLVALRLRRPFAETERIRARYGHLLVPVVAAPDVLDRVPYDVADIEALARLAEAGDRLILHHRDPGGDVYLVSDDTSVFRYRPGPGRIVWGEWSPPRLSDEVTPPDHAATDGTNGASAARNGHGAAPSTGVPLAAFEVAVARPATRESLLVVLTRRLSRWSATTRRPGGRPGRGR
jgi:hypothetical protein